MLAVGKLLHRAFYLAHYLYIRCSIFKSGENLLLEPMLLIENGKPFRNLYVYFFYRELLKNFGKDFLDIIFPCFKAVYGDNRLSVLFGQTVGKLPAFLGFGIFTVKNYSEGFIYS